jgi:hypothetical protein
MKQKCQEFEQEGAEVTENTKMKTKNRLGKSDGPCFLCYLCALLFKFFD